jgi:hypothetical protein
VTSVVIEKLDLDFADAVDVLAGPSTWKKKRPDRKAPARHGAQASAKKRSN